VTSYPNICVPRSITGLKHKGIFEKGIWLLLSIPCNSELIKLCNFGVYIEIFIVFVFIVQKPLLGHKRGFTFTLRNTIFGRTPLESARRRDLYLVTHNTHNRQTSLPPAEFEPPIPGRKRRQSHASDRAVSVIHKLLLLLLEEITRYEFINIATKVV